MKTIKPQKLGLLTRPFEYTRRFYLGVSVFAFIPMGGDRALISEADMWKFAAAELGKDTALDAGIPKAKAEFLVAGSAHVPSGEAKPACSVKASLGNVGKELYVYGDRVWRGSVPGDPVPFTSMPLAWSRTFGGEGFDRNPLGRGFRPVTINEATFQWMPNIVYPTQAFTSPSRPCEPAGFGPQDITWPQRFAKAGTHDEKWLKEEFPGFARDIDWTIFNIAPSDQWFEKHLAGDEPYQMVNMHPDKPILQGRLPSFTARSFVNKKTMEGEEFREVPLRLFTVWFFPHAERAILIYQGVTEIAEEDASDILHMVVACENTGEPRGEKHYQDVLARRLDKEKGHLYALVDGELLPEGLSTAAAARPLAASDGLLRKNLHRKTLKEIEQARAVVASYGLDPDVHGPPLPPPPEEPPADLDLLPAYIEKLRAQAREKKKEDEAKEKERQEGLEKTLAAAGLDRKFLDDELKDTPKGPPVLPGRQEVAIIGGLAEQFKAAGMATEELDQILSDPDREKLRNFADARTAESYRQMAHHQSPAPRLPGNRSDGVRALVIEATAQGKSLAGSDFTGADLSGLDLAGADLEGAYLESANLDGADLKGANLKNAVLAHASLTGAALSKVQLAGANLGSSRLNGAVAHGADFSRAILSKADLTGADFTGSDLSGADLAGAVFGGTDFSSVKAAQTLFLDGSLAGLRLTGAFLQKCSFLKMDVSGTDFSGSDLTSAVFMAARGRGAVFANARMRNVRFVQQCDFESADFTGALLETANLRASLLAGCDFTGAHLTGADLSECVLSNAKLHRATAREARFIKADLRGAMAASVNAMNASFQRADIRGADLRGANLFQADLARVHADPSTRLDDTLSAQVRIHPRRVS